MYNTVEPIVKVLEKEPEVLFADRVVGLDEY